MAGGGPASSGQGMPAFLTRFLGRESEAGELAGLLAKARLVTVVGAPGSGKTRLAVEFGTRNSTEFGDGAWFVDLASVPADGWVPAAVAGALGVAEESGRTAVQTLQTALRTADSLLVLDNCEHVVADAAELVRALLSDCAGVRVLATSRVPLSVGGEQLFQLPPLDLAHAIDLFADRASLIRSDFSLEAAGQEQVSQICRHLDGVPLAIELAAAGTGVLSPAEILDRFDSTLPISAGSATTDPHPRTMESTLAWSYRLLPSVGQRLFEQLSVFTGGFDLRAADAVSDLGTELLAGLHALVEHSLVLAEPTGDGTTRYRLLEPVRQYSEAALAARGSSETVMRRHAEHYLAMAVHGDAGLRGRDRGIHLIRLQREEGNLWAALRWSRRHVPEVGLRMATALAYFWEQRGQVNDARAWLEEFLSHSAGDQRLRASAMARLGRLAWRQRAYQQAWSWYEASLAVTLALGDELGTARGLRNLALVAVAHSDTATAVELCTQSMALFQSQGNDHGYGWTLTVLGLARYADGDFRAGERCYQEALATERRSPGAALAVCAHLGVCFHAAKTVDTMAHREHLTAALGDIRAAGGFVEEPDWLWASNGLAANEGRMRASLRLAGAARALSGRGSNMPETMMEFSTTAVERARSQLGRRAAARLLAQGEAMSVEELMAEALARPSSSDRPLSARERDIAEKAGQGMTNEEIAATLHISRRTVETHLEHVRQKLDLSSRYEIVVWALAQRMGDESAQSG